MRRSLLFQSYIVVLLLSLAAEVSLFPLRGLSVESVPLSVFVIVIGWLFPFFFFRDFLRFLQVNRAILILGALFLVSGLASVFYSPFPRLYTAKWLFGYGLCLGASLNLLFLFSIQRGLGSFFLKTIAVMAVSSSLLSVIEASNQDVFEFLCNAFRSGEQQVINGRFRAGATFQHPNIFGCFASIGILILLSLKERGEVKGTLFFPSALILTIGMALSGSRNGMLVLVIPLALLLLNRKTARTVLVLLLIAAISYAALNPSASRITDLWNVLTKTRPHTNVPGGPGAGGIAAAPREPSTAVTRLMLWQSAVRMFMDHPVFGIGPGGYNRALKAYASDSLRALENPKIEREYLHAHNGFLNLLAEFGLVGTAVAMVFLAWVILNVFRRCATIRPSPVYAIVLGLLISFGPDAFFYSWFFMVLCLSLFFLFGFARASLPNGIAAPSQEPVS